MTQEMELYDIYDFWHVPFWQTSWFVWTLIASVIVITLLIVIFFILYRKRIKRVLPYWEVAYEQLAALLQNSYATAAEQEYAYSTMVRILKQYLATRYEGHAHAMTDDELMRSLAPTACPAELLPVIERILKAGVEIRFAGQKKGSEVVADAITAAMMVIERTKPIEQAS